MPEARSPSDRREHTGTCVAEATKRAEAEAETETPMSLHVCDHPLIQHHLHFIRDERTGHPEFRAHLNDLAVILAVEATRDLPLVAATVRTPLAVTNTRIVGGSDPVLVPILRAGLALVEPFQRLLPNARVGHVGLYRDEKTFEPVPYYRKFPADMDKATVFVMDPMLATGGSAIHAVRLVKDAGARRIRFICVVSAPDGVSRLQEEHPDVPIYAAALDERLNDKAYIVPGLGDAGDRIFGT